jgi:glutathione S-transferase
MMADVLRVPKKLGVLDTFPALQAYVDRACTRPAFKRAYDGQMAHFAAGDIKREKQPT